jgi:heme-degrading monooxygenase HmoA/ketosteroid isomerase-like protein
VTETRLIVFRSRLRDGVGDTYGPHAEQISDLARESPGFVSESNFAAEDGERLTLVEWESEHLDAWREHPTHAAAQHAGHTRYYAEYQLDVCEPVRRSRYDAAHGLARWLDRDPARLRKIAEQWLACFARRDLDGLLALYHDDATHTSPKIRARHPETAGLLRGKSALRTWWADAFARLPTMRYEASAITADARRVYMEYVRRVDGEPDLPVAEVLEVEGGQIVGSRVFHG